MNVLNRKGKIVSGLIGIVLSLSMFTYVHSQLQDNMLTNRIDVSPSVIKKNERAQIKVYVRNGAPKETIILKATATYKIENQEYTVESNEVVLTVDNSVVVSVKLNIGVLKIVDGSVKYDNNPIQYNVRNTNTGTELTADILVPNDNKEHVLSLEVMR